MIFNRYGELILIVSHHGSVYGFERGCSSILWISVRIQSRGRSLRKGMRRGRGRHGECFLFFLLKPKPKVSLGEWPPARRYVKTFSCVCFFYLSEEECGKDIGFSFF